MLKTKRIYSTVCKCLRLPAIFLLLSFSACVSHTSDKKTLNTQHTVANSNAVFQTKNYPNCIVILPAKGDILKNHAVIVEDVLARHFHPYFKRMISPSTRKYIVEKSAYDLSSRKELRHFSKSAACKYGLLATVKKLETNYVVSYALRSFDVAIELVKLNEDKVIWRDSHSASRSAGGLPTGPLGLVMHISNAHNFLNDADGFEALVEDVVRKLSKKFNRFKQNSRTLHN